MRWWSRKFVFLLVWVSLGLGSCKKDDLAPLPYEVNGKLLAGDKGKNKSWRLISVSQQVESGTIDPIAIDDCVADNIYTFSNNNEQSYQATEGPVKCLVSDPDLIEAGTWTFTSDGKMVIILSNHIFPTNPGSLFSFYGFPFPSEVMELKDDSFQIKMTYIKTQGVASLTRYYRLNFEKI